MEGFISFVPARQPAGPLWSKRKLEPRRGKPIDWGRESHPALESFAMLEKHRGIGSNAARANPGGRTFSGTSMLEVEFAALSDAGKVRGGNEDYLGCAVPATAEEVRARGWLFALADGVGGQDRGEVASSTAVETLLSAFRGSRL